MTILILLVSGFYIAGLVRLWRSASLGHGLPVWRAGCFLGGMLILAIALSNPMDRLADQALSMHMLQHILLMKVIAPLLLLGEFSKIFLWSIGKNAAHRAAGIWTRFGHITSLWKQLSSPWVAWTLFAFALWIWHIPAFYQAALKNELLHGLEHMLFLGTSLLFWWYLLQAGRNEVIRYGTAILYLFTTLLHESVLGALLTFSAGKWYALYSLPDRWGLPPLGDQQLAGMIMWLPGGILFGMLIVFYFGAWLRAIEKRMEVTRPEFVRMARTGDPHD